MDITIVSSTFNRAKLLDNALHTYHKQNFQGTWEYILVDDMSTDDTKLVVEKWQKKIPNLRYMTTEELALPKKPGEWRDGCIPRNRASTFAKGKLLILTHPEIMLPPDALTSAWNTANKEKLPVHPWFTAIPYWMPEGTLPKGWKTNLSVIRNMSGFYDPEWPDTVAAPGGVDYRNNNQEIRDSWESEVFCAFWIKDWRWFGGFREFTQWGSVDIDQMNRRRAAGFKTVFMKSDKSPHKNNVLMVYHQNHGSVRDMEKAMQGVRGLKYDNVQAAREAGGLYQIYYHGPRERSHNGTLAGVLGDHVSRYMFAAKYAHGKKVLDVPCGTGYGAKVLFDNCPGITSYHGLDIDGESIEFASINYNRPEVYFHEGDMLDIPLPDDSIELLLCFEGIEHIEDKEKFVNEMYRVLSKGGSFIISTPNPANTPGTAWDRFMLQPAELMDLFRGERWVALDWFHQPSYSIDEVPVQLGFDSKAQIMLLGGSVVK